MIGSLFLDFRKAFDVLDHSILHEKLKLYKFSGPTLAWFKSYLEGRTQQVCISNITSQPQTTTSGVPQGSVLGPLLFILYINDLSLHVNTQTDIFADDTTLSSIGKSAQELNTSLSTALNLVKTWCTNNAMILNCEKTNAMIIASRFNHRKLKDENLHIDFHGEVIKNVCNEKLLGVLIDNILSWESHINQILQRVNPL